MKTLLSEDDLHELVSRLMSLQPDSPRKWGRMTPHQMLCHCSDTFRMAMAEISVPPRKKLFAGALVKWGALYSRVPWPHGFPTRRQLDQLKDGTPPIEFEKDRAGLADLLARFSKRKADYGQHALFGELSTKDWMRWAYLHTSHHLSQFGC